MSKIEPIVVNRDKFFKEISPHKDFVSAQFLKEIGDNQAGELDGVPVIIDFEVGRVKKDE